MSLLNGILIGPTDHPKPNLTLKFRKRVEKNAKSAIFGGAAKWTARAVIFFASRIQILNKKNKKILGGTLPFFTIHPKMAPKMCEKAPKMHPPPPLTPRDPFFGLGGMCSKWPMPKNAISLFYWVNLRCFVPIFINKLEKCAKKRPPGGPPPPLTPPKRIFMLGGAPEGQFFAHFSRFLLKMGTKHLRLTP